MQKYTVYISTTIPLTFMVTFLVQSNKGQVITVLLVILYDLFFSCHMIEMAYDMGTCDYM